MGAQRWLSGTARGCVDTCTYIDLDLLEPERLPVLPVLTAVSLAELQQGVADGEGPARCGAA
ncbi:hypothetical protein GTW37_36650, partial [Streptomyces sp. SID4931]|nr:hypothetical protein [Streptomyces sp. SID4931]